MKHSTFSHIAITAAIVFSCISCSNIEMENEQASELFSTNQAYIKLEDNGTEIAGVLYVTSGISVADLKWNVLPECNIDTSMTKITFNNGVYELPIKWAKQQKGGSFGSPSLAYNAGVFISSGSTSKYVPIIWADEVDKASLDASAITTRSTEAMPKVITLKIWPELIEMDPVSGGEAFLSFSGAAVAILDCSLIEDYMNINLTQTPTVWLEPGVVAFRWNYPGGPTTDFITHVRFTAGSLTKYGYLHYVYKRPQ